MDQNDLERRRRFFYAEVDAGLYDVSIGWVVPRYDLLHGSVLRALAPIEREISPVLLDVGAGTGADTLAVLDKFPAAHVVAVDFCEPMLRRLEARLTANGNRSLLDRVTIVHADVLDETTDWRAWAGDRLRNGGYSAVLSTLTVHHFTHAEKRRYLIRAAEVLARDGVCVLADLFSHVEPSASLSALEFDLAWMRKHFGSDPVPTGAPERSVGERRRLLDHWTQHYESDNRLESIESHGTIVGQAELMRTAGLRFVRTEYRHSLSGVLVGRR
jgi:hypothetical protein